MANWGKAFQGLAKGFIAGKGLEEEQKRTKIAEQELISRDEDRKALRELQEVQKRIAEKSLNLQEEGLGLQKQKMGLEVLGSMGIKEYTPIERESVIKNFNEKFGIDISPHFQENKDEKSGVVKSYVFSTPEAIQKQQDAQVKDLEKRTALVNAATSKINAETAYLKAKTGDNPKDAMDWFINKSGVLTKDMTPEQQRDKVAEFANMTKGGMEFSVETTKEGGTKITYGPKGGKQEPGTKLEMEKNLNALQDQLFSLSEVNTENAKKYLTYAGKLKDTALNQLDKIKKEDLKPEQKLFVQEAWNFRSSVGRVFDAYRAEVTKSAAAVAELKMLEDRTLNMSMGPAVAEGAKNYLTARLNRLIRLKRLAIKNGVNSEDVWSKLDGYVRMGSDPSLDKENIDARGDQLKEVYIQSKTKTKEKYTDIDVNKFVQQQLKQEGYLP